MKTIWKATLLPADSQKIEMPKNAKVLTVQPQKDNACMWFLCDPNAPTETREFAVYGTNHIIDERFKKYVGTFQLYEGGLVFHVFERGEE